MGDTFFKTFFISCFVILFLAGGIMLFSRTKESIDRAAIKKYVETRGKSGVPRALQGKIGKGI